MQIPVNDENSIEVTLPESKPVMPLFQQRVLQEKQELDDKIKKLVPFIDGEIYKKLPEDEQVRLRKQVVLMSDYSEVLGERIAAFPAPSLTIVP